MEDEEEEIDDDLKEAHK